MIKTEIESIGITEIQKRITNEIYSGLIAGYSIDVFPSGKTYPYIGKNYNDQAIRSFHGEELMFTFGGFFNGELEDNFNDEGKLNCVWRKPKKYEIMQWVQKNFPARKEDNTQ